MLNRRYFLAALAGSALAADTPPTRVAKVVKLFKSPETVNKVRPTNIPPYPNPRFPRRLWYLWSATRLAVMCESGVEEAEAVVSAALGAAQARAESHLLAAGALGAMRRQGGPGDRRAVGGTGCWRPRACPGASAKFVDALLPQRISNPSSPK